MSMEIRPDSSDKNLRQPEPYNFKNSLQQLLDKIIDSVKIIFTGLSGSVFPVDRKMIGPADEMERQKFERVGDYVKYVTADKSIYLFSEIPDFKPTASEQRKIDNTKHEIPGDVLKVAKRVLFEGTPIAILNAECSPIEKGGEQLAVAVQMQEVNKPIILVFDSDHFDIKRVAKEMLPELFQEAFEVFGVKVSVQEA